MHAGVPTDRNCALCAQEWPKSGDECAQSVSTISNRAIRVEGGELIERNPSRIEHLVDWSDVEPSGDESLRQIDVGVGRLLSPRWNRMCVDAQ